MTEDEILFDKIAGSLFGNGIGDALGAPVELMTREQILEKTDGAGVRDYMDPLQEFIKDTMRNERGMTTDDNQLTLSTASAVASAHGFDEMAEAAALAREVASGNDRWGGTIKKGGHDFRDWFASNGERGRHPLRPVEPPKKIGDGIGTAPSMRVAGLPLWNWSMHSGDWTLLTDAIMRFGRMTHGDPRASYAALGVAGAIQWAIWKRELDDWTRDDFVPAYNCIVAKVIAAERRYDIAYAGNAFVFDGVVCSERFQFAIDLAFDKNVSDEQLSDRLYDGWLVPKMKQCSSLAAVPIAIAYACRYIDDFEKAILATVNAGGDADTTAAICGSIVGANVGLSGIPQRFIDGLLPAPRIREVAETFFAAAMDARSGVRK